MPQYIQHPALMGAQMADEMSRQRLNLWGQAIALSADAMNKEVAAENAAERQALVGQESVIGPDGRVTYRPVDPAAQEKLFRNLYANRARRMGINVGVEPGDPNAVIGSNIAPATQGMLMNIPQLQNMPGFEHLKAWTSPETVAAMNTLRNVPRKSFWSEVLGIAAPTQEPYSTGATIFPYQYSNPNTKSSK